MVFALDSRTRQLSSLVYIPTAWCWGVNTLPAMVYEKTGSEGVLVWQRTPDNSLLRDDDGDGGTGVNQYCVLV